MDVTVKLFADLREGKPKETKAELADQTTIKEVIESLDILPEDVAISMVNGRDANQDQALQAGDTLSLFPPVGGA